MGDMIGDEVPHLLYITELRHMPKILFTITPLPTTSYFYFCLLLFRNHKLIG